MRLLRWCMVGASFVGDADRTADGVSGGVSFEGESYLITLPFIASQTRLNTFRVLFIKTSMDHASNWPSSTLILVHRPASLATVTPHSLIPGITTLKNKAKPAGLSPTPTPLTHPYTLQISNHPVPESPSHTHPSCVKPRALPDMVACNHCNMHGGCL